MKAGRFTDCSHVFDTQVKEANWKQKLKSPLSHPVLVEAACLLEAALASSIHRHPGYLGPDTVSANASQVSSSVHNLLLDSTPIANWVKSNLISVSLAVISGSRIIACAGLQ